MKKLQLSVKITELTKIIEINFNEPLLVNTLINEF